MIAHRIENADGWVQIGSAGVVIAQARSGAVKIAISAAAPALDEAAFFVLRPDNENVFQMQVANSVWAASASGATVVVSQDGT